MAKKYKTVKGLRMALDLDPNKLDWGGPADPELLAALKRTPKVRITAWVDADIIERLKDLAAESSEEMGYQTAMNALLRSVLFPESKPKRKAKPRKAS